MPHNRDGDAREVTAVLVLLLIIFIFEGRAVPPFITGGSLVLCSNRNTGAPLRYIAL